mmetsp:Transcript_43847/g.139733  ORF Transcript_43847/g.139733 Transcript_43847/m.139733 type:complete len:395 (+) Transcript_43847:179-1363(+)
MDAYTDLSELSGTVSHARNFLALAMSCSCSSDSHPWRRFSASFLFPSFPGRATDGFSGPSSTAAAAALPPLLAAFLAALTAAAAACLSTTLSKSLVMTSSSKGLMGCSSPSANSFLPPASARTPVPISLTAFSEKTSPVGRNTTNLKRPLNSCPLMGQRHWASLGGPVLPLTWMFTAGALWSDSLGVSLRLMTSLRDLMYPRRRGMFLCTSAWITLSLLNRFPISSTTTGSTSTSPDSVHWTKRAARSSSGFTLSAFFSMYISRYASRFSAPVTPPSPPPPRSLPMTSRVEFSMILQCARVHSSPRSLPPCTTRISPALAHGAACRARRLALTSPMVAPSPSNCSTRDGRPGTLVNICMAALRLVLEVSSTLETRASRRLFVRRNLQVFLSALW